MWIEIKRVMKNGKLVFGNHWKILEDVANDLVEQKANILQLDPELSLVSRSDEEYQEEFEILSADDLSDFLIKQFWRWKYRVPPRASFKILDWELELKFY